ncbi:MAG: alpha-glucosidase C-terminal domain-containing protein [Treponema sp.]|jgi:glycosidase|nr:alpha-glucosidase C-terminal domain-containing protein [Treponema sp.]
MFYHIYPLGFCGCPAWNDFSSPAGDGLRGIESLIPHLRRLGVDAVYIGPLFESTAHGYDTLDYFHIDRRLGNNADFHHLSRAFHQNDMRVVLDAVFNHVGRHFFAFKDVQQNCENSLYRDWFANLDFSKYSPQGDSFMYEGWNDYYDLVKLNGYSRAVREHLFAAVEFWIREFDIDGLRLDAADQLLPDFMDDLSQRCQALKPDFWLIGEVVAGDYRKFLFNESGGKRLDSVTNYELYKGLWSSFNDRNFFEIAWTLNRQFGEQGLYRNSLLYSFADNHDVNRVASILKNPVHLFPLYGLLFTMPGIPSLYYGSEFGVTGTRSPHSDKALRPSWETVVHSQSPVHSADLFNALKTFAEIRKNSPALQNGSYRQLYVSHEQFAFARTTDRETVVVAVNASKRTTSLTLPVRSNQWKDRLNGEIFSAPDGVLRLSLFPSWIRVLATVSAS